MRHSIWELVSHITSWERAALLRLAGEAARFYNTGQDWPESGAAVEGAWQQTLARLVETNASLRDAMLQIDDSKLDEPIHAEMQSTYVTLHGVCSTRLPRGPDRRF